MGISPSIRDFNELLNGMPQSQLDDYVGVDKSSGELRVVKSEATVASSIASERKSDGGCALGGRKLKVNRATTAKTTAAKPSANSSVNFLKVRTDLSRAVKNKLGGYMKLSPLAYDYGMRVTFQLMDQDAPGSQPLTGRNIKQVLEDTSKVAAEASVEAFNADEKNAKLVNRVETARGRLGTLRGTVGEDTKEKINGIIAAFEWEIGKIRKMVSADADGDVMGEYRRVYETFAKAAEDVQQEVTSQKEGQLKRQQDEAKVNDYRAQTNLEAAKFAEDARRIIRHLKDELIAKYGAGDGYLPKDDIVTAFAKFEAEIARECDDAKKSAENVTAENADTQGIARRFSDKLNALQVNAGKVRDELESVRESRIKIEQQGLVFTAQCKHELNALRKKCDFELEKGFGQLWEEAFGGSDVNGRRVEAEGKLREFRKAIDAEAQKLLSDALKASGAPEGGRDTPEAQKERFAAARQGLSDSLKDRYEKLCKLEDELIAAEKATRQNERKAQSAEIVEDYRNQIAVIVKKFGDATADKFKGLSRNGGSDRELSELYDSLKSELEGLAKAPEGEETPQAAEKRLDGVVNLVNTAYTRLSVKEHAVKAEKFAAELAVKVEKFEDRATAEVEAFKSEWNKAFPNDVDHPRLGQAGLDRTCNAIVKKLEKMRDAFAAEALVKFDDGTKKLPEDIDGKFDAEVRKIVAEGQGRLERARYLEMLRVHNGQEFDDAMSALADLAYRLGDVIVAWKFPDADGRSPESEMQQRLHDRFRDVSAFLDTTYGKLGEVDDVSPFALSVATRQINAFVERFDKAIVAANRKPEQLLARLKGVKLPEIVFKSVDEELADEAFFRNADDVSGLVAEGYDDVPQEVRDALGELKTKVLAKYQDVKGLQDPSARYAFQKEAREAFAEIAEAVKDAAAVGGLELDREDVYALAQPAWGKITGEYARLVNASRLTDVERTAEDVRTRLERALAQVPTKFTSQRLIALRAHAYDLELQALDQHVDAMCAKLDALTGEGRTLDHAELDRVLDDLVKKADDFIRRANSKSNYDVKKKRVPGPLAFKAPSSWRVNNRESWNGGVASDHYDSLENLKERITEGQDRTRTSIAASRETTWDGLLERELERLSVANGERTQGIRRRSLPEEPKPVKGDKAVADKRRELAAALSDEGAKIEKKISDDGIEKYNNDLEAQDERARVFKEKERLAAEEERKAAERLAAEEREAAKKLLQEQKRAEERKLTEKLKLARFDKEAEEPLAKCAEKLRQSFSLLFLNCAGMDRYRLVDDCGNHAGWDVDGRTIIEAAVAKQLETERSNAYLLFGKRDNPFDGLGDSVKDGDAVKLLDSARAELEKKSGVVSVGEETDGPRYPRGDNVFGLDVNRLDEKQRAGLRCLVRSCLFDPNSGSNDPGDYELRNPGRKYPTDEIVNKALLSDGFPKKRMVAAALAKGLDLSKLTQGYANLLLKSAESLAVCRAPKAGMPEVFGGLAIEDLCELDRMYESLGITPRLAESFTMKQSTGVVYNLGVLRLINNRRNDGLAATCQRVFGVDVKTFVNAVVDRDREEYRGLAPLITKVYNVAVKIVDNGDDVPPSTWRADWDPLVTARDSEKKAIAILEHRHAFGPGDKADVEAFGEALGRIRAKPVGGKEEVVIANTRVELTKTDNRHVSATVSLSAAVVKRDKDGDIKSVKYDRRNVRKVPVAVPVTIDTLADGLDEAILTHVGTYGVEAARKVFEAKVGVVGKGVVASSRTRQLCMDVLRSYAGLTTDKLCFASTDQLVNLTSTVLSDDYYTKLSVAERGRTIVNRKLVAGVSETVLNSSATLELYRKYLERCQNDSNGVQSKVSVPEPARVRRNESLEKALTRRVHEFAADLVQLHDTTKFDLDRIGGKSDVDMLRDVLLAHRAEVEELLKDEGNRLLNTFTFTVGTAKLNAFTKSLRNLVSGLRGLCGDKDGNYDALFERIASPTDTKVIKLLKEARRSFDDNSKAVLESLQAVFEAEFRRSFAKIAGPGGEDMWRKQLSELTNTATIDPSKGYGKFLQQVIGQYFTEMSVVDRNRMAAQVMRFATGESSTGQLLGALLKGAGPILQKFMQGLPQSALPEVLRDAVADLKSNLAPIPEEAVRAYLLDVVEESHDYIKSITVRKSLGAASVGQAFLCVVKTVDHPEGEECVIKVLRPDAQSRAHREENFFRRMADGSKVLAMLEDRFARIYEELDLTVEAANVARGGVYDPEGRLDGDVTVRSMKLHPAANSTSNVMFLRRAPGETYDQLLDSVRRQRRELESGLDDITGDDGVRRLRSNDMHDKVCTRRRLVSLYKTLSQRQSDLCNFVTRWTEEVAFQGGFFHGDVHAGNIMASPAGLTVIDFGNATQLTEAQRKSIMFMLSCAHLKNPKKFLKYVSDLLPASSKETIDLLKKEGAIYGDLQLIFDKGISKDVGKRFIAALQHLQNSGVELPGSLFNLMECMRRLDESINAINREMAEIKKSAFAVQRPDGAIDTDACYWFDEKLSEYVNEYLSQQPPKAIRAQAIKDKLATPEYVGWLKNTIRASCGTRKGYEALMKDVRRMMKRVDLSDGVDYRSMFAEILASAERDPAFFDSANKEAFAAAQERFAAKLADRLVMMQKELTSKYAYDPSLSTITQLPRPMTFAEAVGVAVNNNIGKLKSDIGVFDGMEMYMENQAIQKAEGEYKERMAAADRRVRGDDRLSDVEQKFLRRQGAYFDAPLGFSEMLTSGWTKKPDIRRKALDVFGNALERMYRAMADDDIKDHEIGGESGRIVFARMMANYFFAQYAESGFAKLREQDLQPLLDEAKTEAKLGHELEAFIKEVHRLANLPPPPKAKKK